jgi:two-component system response regulator NreC
LNNIRIVIADDHAVLRSGLKKLLSDQPDINVIGEAIDGNEAISQSVKLEPDVLLLDITMPGLGGIDAIREIKAKTPKVAIIVLTMHEDEGHFIEALKSGVSGYIPKKAADTELITAIRAVYEGENYIYHSFSKTMVTQILNNDNSNGVKEVDSYETLSQREQEIFILLAQGFTNQQIASQLFLSVKTIETYKARVMNKLNLHSRVELVRFALKRNLLE